MRPARALLLVLRAPLRPRAPPLAGVPRPKWASAKAPTAATAPKAPRRSLMSLPVSGTRPALSLSSPSIPCLRPEGSPAAKLPRASRAPKAPRRSRTSSSVGKLRCHSPPSLLAFPLLAVSVARTSPWALRRTPPTAWTRCGLFRPALRPPSMSAISSRIHATAHTRSRRLSTSLPLPRLRSRVPASRSGASSGSPKRSTSKPPRRLSLSQRPC